MTPYKITLKQLLERLHVEPRVGHDPAHGIGVYGIVARDGKKPLPVGHHHMLAAFTDDAKAGLDLRREWRGDGRRPGSWASLIGHLDFPDILADKCCGNGSLIFHDGITDVTDGLGLGRALGPASGQARAIDAITLVGLSEDYSVFHTHRILDHPNRTQPRPLYMSSPGNPKPNNDGYGFQQV